MAGISKINKIKGLAVFSDYTWDTKLDPFKRYNLIYGWNGSGKTAISRLFDSLESGTHEDFSDLEFQVTAADEKKYTQENPFTNKVRVFNSDYVQRNVNVVDGHASPIYVLGEQSKETLQAVQQDQKVLNGTQGDASDPGKIELRRRAAETRSQMQREIQKEFTNVARTISAAWTTAGAVRTYRRPNALARFNELTGKQILSKENLETCSLTLSETVKPELDLLSIPGFDGESVNIETAVGSLSAEINMALATKVQKIAIERLSKNKVISHWVEEGLALHAAHGSETCEFCQQVLPLHRLDELNAHFSQADRKLKQQIDSIIQRIETIKSAVHSVKPYDSSKLYKQYEVPCEDKVAALNDESEALTKSLALAAAALTEKKNKTGESLSFDVAMAPTAFLQSISKLNDILAQHNNMTMNHEAKQDSARLRIQDHYLSTIYDDIRKKEERLSGLQSEIMRLDEGDPDVEGDLGIGALKARIAANRAKVSSAHKSCGQINEKLRTLFGRDEISFAVRKDEKGQTVGYEIIRDGKPAKNISEGEKTAIAFTYFCIHLTEHEFAIDDGIVVVDDPISSLDSGLLFRVCAAIKKQMKSASQLVILTHNFEFFNHLKKWFLNDPQICGQGDEPVANYRLFMVKNGFDHVRKRRFAWLSDLDPMLRDYESEYHYLFKKLATFDTDGADEGQQTIQEIYDYPTIARKLLECFLSFRVPSKGRFYVRMLDLKRINKQISGEDIEFVYNFVNSHSHLDTKNGLVQFDPTLAVSGPDAIKRTLKLVEQSDASHYKAMCKAVKKQ